MDIKQLEVLVNVIDTKSFSAAAQKLYLTQPTVSAHISALEKELESVLLERTTKEVSPSSKGMLLYGYAKRILALRDEAASLLLDENLAENRTVTIAAPRIVSDETVREMTAEYLLTNSAVIVNMLRHNSAECERQVLKGAAQFGIVLGKNSNSKLRYYTLFYDKLLLAVPANCAAQTAQEALELMSGCPVYVDRVGSGIRKQSDRCLRRLGVSVRLRPVESCMHALAAVNMGKGIAMVCNTAIKSCPDTANVKLYELGEGTRFAFYAVTRSGSVLAPQAKTALRYIKKHFSELRRTEQL